MDLIYIILAVLILMFILYEKFLRRIRIGSIHKKYVLITGCDTGFGRHTARKLDSMGCHVIAGCLKEESVKELQKECSSRLLAVRFDVTKETDVKQAAKRVSQHIPKTEGLHCVINNAGILGQLGPMEWMTVEAINQVLNVNFYGMFNVTNAFLPLLKRAPGSRIVNTASVAGRLVIPNSGMYSLSKCLVEAYCDAIRRELRPFGISVHTIEPGANLGTTLINEDFVNNSIEKSWNALSPELKEEYGRAYVEKIKYLSTDIVNKVSSTTVDGVINAYEHASFSRFPKTRYTIGGDSVAYILISYLPSRIQDWLFSLDKTEAKPASCCR